MPTAIKARSSASLPDAQPTAWEAPTYFDSSRSSSATRGPRMNPCSSHTAARAFWTSSRIVRYCALRSSSGTFTRRRRSSGKGCPGVENSRWRSQEHDVVLAAFDVARCIPRIEDHFRVTHDLVVIESGMRGQDHDGVALLNDALVQGDSLVRPFPQGEVRHERVGIGQVRA